MPKILPGEPSKLNFDELELVNLVEVTPNLPTIVPTIEPTIEPIEEPINDGFSRIPEFT